MKHVSAVPSATGVALDAFGCDAGPRRRPTHPRRPLAPPAVQCDALAAPRASSVPAAQLRMERGRVPQPRPRALNGRRTQVRVWYHRGSAMSICCLEARPATNSDEWGHPSAS